MSLVARVSASLSRARTEPADSFILHAPLELLARDRLLPLVAAERIDEARERIRSIATRYEAHGAPTSVDPVPVDDATAGTAALSRALSAGDVDRAEALAAGLAAGRTTDDLAPHVADLVLPHLGAAAHGAILFALGTGRRAPAGPFAPLARELARVPDWQLGWLDDLPAEGPEPAADALVASLCGVPVSGVPGSDFIFPLMRQAETTGLAPRHVGEPLAGRTIAPPTARAWFGRIAAWSMLQEPTDHAPYGWTHCLTMPRATLALASRGTDPRRAVAVAGTYIVGFRTALGSRALDPDWVPRTTDAPVTASWADPDAAAAAAWYTAPADRPHLCGVLATEASIREDAHLVKYTESCIDASRDDPDAGHVYLAAAAKLVSHWIARDPVPVVDRPRSGAGGGR